LYLEGKVALVTGGGKEPGQKAALGLAFEGANLAILDSDGSKAEQIAQEIRERYDRKAIALEGDFSSSGEASRLVSEIVGKLGTIDILVTAEGVVREASFTQLTYEDFLEVLNRNLRSVFLTVQSVGRIMSEKQSGVIICLSPVGGWQTDYCASYCAARGGLYGFVRTIAKEFTRYNIRVNAVMLPTLPFTDKDIWKTYSSRLPLGCLATSDDLPPLVAFLASEKSKYITGQVIGEPWY